MKLARSESRQKTKLVQVRATPLEKDALKARADSFGISVGELCRNAIFGVKLNSLVDQDAISELARTRADLGRLGGLLKGWLAGKFKQGVPEPITYAEVAELRRKIDAAQQAVLDAVNKVAGKS